MIIQDERIEGVQGDNPVGILVRGSEVHLQDNDVMVPGGVGIFAKEANGISVLGGVIHDCAVGVRLSNANRVSIKCKMHSNAVNTQIENSYNILEEIEEDAMAVEPQEGSAIDRLEQLQARLENEKANKAQLLDKAALLVAELANLQLPDYDALIAEVEAIKSQLAG